MSLVTSPLKGEQQLWVVFFLLYIPYVFGIEYLLPLLPQNKVHAFQIYMAINSVIGAYFVVAFWKCAFNSNLQFLGYLSRAWAVVMAISIPYSLHFVFFGISK